MINQTSVYRHLFIYFFQENNEDAQRTWPISHSWEEVVVKFQHLSFRLHKLPIMFMGKRLTVFVYVTYPQNKVS